MEDLRNKKNAQDDKSVDTDQVKEETSYPVSVESMSDKWRSIQQQSKVQDQRGFFERHFIALGLFIGLLIFALLIVIGGFAFLVWNAR